MNSYSIAITGHYWLLALLAGAAICFAMYSYRNTLPPLSNARRRFLITIRASALILLLVILFEPLFVSTNPEFISPKVAVLLDNSLSMSITDAKYNRDKQYRKFISEWKLNNLGDDVLFYGFDEDIYRCNPDSLKLNGTRTDISQAFRYLNNGIAEDNNVRAIVLISDGVFNSGNSPIFDAEGSAKPVYTIAIGDTALPKDISVNNLLMNEFAYIDNTIPITVSVSASGFDGRVVAVGLYDNGKLINSQEISLYANRYDYTATFEYLPKIEGMHKITAKIDKIDGELTDKNNVVSSMLKVLNNSRTVAIFADAPSPDYSFVKRVLSDEPGVKILEFVQKKGAEFYNNEPFKQPTPALLHAADVFIFVGFPSSNTNDAVISAIQAELNTNHKAIFFIAGLNTNYAKLKTLSDALPFTSVSSKPNEFLTSVNINPSALSNPLLRITGTDEDIALWNTLPPIFKTETFVKAKPNAEVLSTMKVNNTIMDEPLILTQEFQKQKSVAIMGYGLYRWKMLGYASKIASGQSSYDLFEILVDNAYRWLSLKDKDKQVNIRTTKNFYNQSEKIEFIGEIYDASFIPIEDANVVIELGNETGNRREIKMTAAGNGRYTATVEGLAKGDHNWKATATSGSRNLGNDNGRFNIGELAVEYQNLRSNYALLRSIAERTGGKFYTDDVSTLLKDIKSGQGFEERPIIHKSETLLWNWFGLLVLIITLFVTEWFIRKRSGLL